MSNTESREETCKDKLEVVRAARDRLPEIVEKLIHSCRQGECFSHVGPEPIPSLESVINILQETLRMLFPGYFVRDRLDDVNLRYYLGQEANLLFESFSKQIGLAIRHDCIRYGRPCIGCEERGQQAAIEFLGWIPELRALLAKDVRAAYEGDPSAKSFDEIIFSYPGLYAISVHRIAHKLHEMEIPLLPRIMSEYAHSRTGIDIHPAAHLGESFFIDHGTGVVIGETTIIGNNVRIYQGVTLGALSIPKDSVETIRNRKRHPTIEDRIIIYSGATILGGDTVIGHDSIIGGNVWITESVPPHTKVYLKRSELTYGNAVVQEIRSLRHAAVA